MAGNPWFPLQAEPRVLALSAYAYQRGVSLLLAMAPVCYAILIASSLQPPQQITQFVHRPADCHVRTYIA
jgi:hypothetical protein